MSLSGSSSIDGGPALGSVLGWVVFACSLCAACDSAPERYYGTTTPRHGPDEVWSNLGAEPEWIDPGKGSDNAGGVVIMNCFAGLVQPHPETLRPMPDLARSWRISADGRTYTFYLRESTWSDGTPLTAHDFEHSFKRVLDRETASKYASFLYPIENAEAYHRQALAVRLPRTETALQRLSTRAREVAREVEVRPTDGGALVFVGGDATQADATRAALVRALGAASIEGQRLTVTRVSRGQVAVEAVDELTLRVQLENPVPYFLDMAMFYTMMPVPRHVIARLEAQGESPDLWTRVENIVTNGAYRLVEWKFRQHMVFERNPLYWDADNVRMHRVRLSMVESANTTLNLYEAGELDYTGTSALPSEFMDHLEKFDDFRRGPFLATYFYWLNTKAPPLDDPRVRRALSLAIDREALVKYVTRAGQIPTASLVPAGVGGYRGPRRALFDPARARALMAEAGHGPGSALPPVTLLYNTSEGHKQVAEAIQGMWKEHLGVDVAIENQEWKVYLKNLQAMSFQMARMGWIGDYADPFTFLELLVTGNGNNHSNYSDPGYDALLRRANAENDRSRRLELLRDAEERALDAAPLIPLYVYTRSELVKPYLRGNWMNYQQRQLFKYWWIDERYYGGVPAEPAPAEPPPLVVPAPPPPVDAGARDEVVP